MSTTHWTPTTLRETLKQAERSLSLTILVVAVFIYEFLDPLNVLVCVVNVIGRYNSNTAILSTTAFRTGVAFHLFTLRSSLGHQVLQPRLWVRVTTQSRWSRLASTAAKLRFKIRCDRKRQPQNYLPGPFSTSICLALTTFLFPSALSLTIHRVQTRAFCNCVPKRWRENTQITRKPEEF